MRDWFSASALYVPLWIIAGTVMGLWGTGMGNPVGALWVLIGCAIAALAWRASAHQAKESRLISENLGKLVSVTEPSPANILAAAGAKILTLDNELRQLKEQMASRWRSLTDQEREDFVATLRGFKIQANGGGPTVMMFPDHTRHDAVELSHTLSTLCHDVDWYGMSYQNPLQKGVHCPPGLTVHADQNRLEVQTFLRAYIQYRLEGEVHLGTIEITIGRHE
jgi:hypothetical protein